VERTTKVLAITFFLHFQTCCQELQDAESFLKMVGAVSPSAENEQWTLSELLSSLGCKQELENHIQEYHQCKKIVAEGSSVLVETMLTFCIRSVKNEDGKDPKKVQSILTEAIANVNGKYNGLHVDMIQKTLWAEGNKLMG
jgi:hypothetical protein